MIDFVGTATVYLPVFAEQKKKSEPATGWYANTLPGITDESSGTKNKRSENA